MRRAVSLVLFALAALLLTACQTDAYLEVQVDDDGGGAVYVAVALDQEAAAKSILYEGKPPNTLPIDDLVRAGWTVTGPTQEQDGRIWMRAQKEFSQPDQLPQVVAEVAGPSGPFRDFTVQRSTRFGEQEWQFSGTVDFSGGLAAFSDEGVAAQFGGAALGQPPEVYAQQLGTPLEQLVKMTVVVDLPGEFRDNNGVIGSAGLAAPTTTTTARATGDAAPTTAAGVPTTLAPRSAGRGAAVVWNPAFADAAPTQLQANSSSRRLLPRVWRWAAVVAGLVGVVALLYRLGQTFLDRRREQRRASLRPVPRKAVGAAEADEPQPVPVGRFGDAGGAEPAPMVIAPAASAPPPSSPVTVAQGSPTEPEGDATAGPAAPAASTSPGGRGLRLIVIETSGALLTGRDPVGDVLVPFCRERGCVLSVRQIADLYLSRVVGTTSAADFWSELGLSGDPVLLDDGFARRFELTDHVVGFLSQARQRGVAVAALGDDVPEWTGVHRQRFKLDGLIATWICSAEVGVRIPHPGLLEAAERTTGVAADQAMLIAASRSLLDAAARRGYRTVQYNPGPDDPDSDHPVLRSFAERGRPAPSPSNA
ncbi:MAG: hypothetical protein IT196_08195 [Acidimicrobiales bacterium]|nr:hypothetical protein [Acidimicrobiales bacterium]